MAIKRNFFARIGLLLLLLLAIFLFRQLSPGTPAILPGFDRQTSDLVITRHARCRMDCRHISRSEVLDILHRGRINYAKSEPKGKPDPKYALEGKTADGQQVRIIFAASAKGMVVVTVIDLGREWACNCP